MYMDYCAERCWEGGREKSGRCGCASPHRLNASAAGRLWAGHVPSTRLCTLSAALLGLCIQVFGLSPFSLEQGLLFVPEQQRLCFLIQKMPYRRGLYHYSCFANGGNRKGSNLPSGGVDEQSGTEPLSLPSPVVISSDVSVTKQSSPVRSIYYKILQNINNLSVWADRASLVAVTDNHGLKLLAMSYSYLSEYQ